MVQLYTTR